MIFWLLNDRWGISDGLSASVSDWISGFLLMKPYPHVSFQDYFWWSWIPWLLWMVIIINSSINCNDDPSASLLELFIKLQSDCDHYQYHLYTYLWFDYGSVHKSWGTPQGGMPLATHSTRSFNNLAAAKRKHRHWTTRPPHVRSVHTWWTSKSDVCSTKINVCGQEVPTFMETPTWRASIDPQTLMDYW